LTFGTAAEGEASAADNDIVVFSSLSSTANLWKFKVPSAPMKTTAPIERLTHSTQPDMLPSVSADGQKVAFARGEIGWVKDLRTNSENSLGVSMFPKISPDGQRVAYTPAETWTTDVNPVFVVNADGGGRQQVSDNCGLPIGWTPTGDALICRRETRAVLKLLNLRSGGCMDLLTTLSTETCVQVVTVVSEERT
jgi:Tol biopolymer transport system component